MELPIEYSKTHYSKRKQARLEYIKRQDGLCHYCKHALTEAPPKEITDKPLNVRLFPPHFLSYPIHLHHSHDTDLTIGAVHSYCNGVLWQYEGE